MTPQEREVIDSIFDRLRAAANQPRDPEAERHIADLVRQQPYATYALAQSVYVQEQALNNLQAEVDALTAERDQLREAARQQQAQPQQSGGFLSGLFGGGARPQAEAAPQPGPWNRQPGAAFGQQSAADAAAPAGSPLSRAGSAQQQPAAGGGSGFLGTALTTAAGVAGGMVVGNMLMNAFKGGSGDKAASQPASDFQPFGSRDEAERHAANHDQNAHQGDHHGYDEANYGDDGDYGGDSYDA